ncbi:slr1658 superfamily regulator [Mesorhizobium sp. B1-1-8]|uniref:slr1658 superfamily regulator n=1 Tax=Mesorhizobium sp. B1-1-8 TaxID=2589976 RepID=UPI00112B7138|nr:ATP-binding protein [Mesorhizobium sp. B1-1-8]UCI07158.1 ATP-binding protein [Mesorhizobium sp. B1-1-8]
MMQQFGATQLSNSAAAQANRLRLSDGPLELGWHHCGTTSDFLADFFANLARKSNANYNDALHSIGYLLNELLENAVKFRAAGDIVINATLENNNFEVRVCNLVAESTAARFQRLLEEITARDPGELLIERIELNAADPSSSASGLGLLTLMSDYGVGLGWNFRRDASSGPVRVETCASLPLS